MVNIINSFFLWVAAILSTWLNIEIIDGFNFYHIFIFLGIVYVLTSFIKQKDSGAGKNDRSE